LSCFAIISNRYTYAFYLLGTQTKRNIFMTTAIIANIKEDNDLLLLILEDATSDKTKGDQLEAKLLEAVKQAGRCKANLSTLKIPFDADTEIN